MPSEACQISVDFNLEYLQNYDILLPIKLKGIAMKLVKDLGNIKKKPTDKRNRRWGIYECPECSSHVEVLTHSVTSGKATRCLKCGRKSGATKHGGSKDKLYSIRSGIKNRCLDKNNKHYSDYGGRGITICEEWKENYETFRDWALANGYQDGLTIDRIDNDKGYYPENCRWVSQNIQSQNTRRLRKNNTSGYRGVSCKKGRFEASISHNGEIVLLGLYSTPLAAAIARDEYVIKHNTNHTLNNISKEEAADGRLPPLKISRLSKYPGVYKASTEGKWISECRVEKKQKYLGTYDSEEEAYQAIQAFRSFVKGK